MKEKRQEPKAWLSVTSYEEVCGKLLLVSDVPVELTKVRELTKALEAMSHGRAACAIRHQFAEHKLEAFTIEVKFE